MPELPEVETTRRGVRDAIVGHAVTAFDLREPRLRWRVDPQLVLRTRRPAHSRRASSRQVPADRSRPRLAHRTPRHVRQLARDAGRFAAAAARPLRPRARIGPVPALQRSAPVWQPASGARARWRSIRCWPQLGPEPLEDAFTAELLATRAKRRKAAVKLFLMDQHVVVGVGNIYASEALFRAGVRPRRAAGRIKPAEWQRIVASIRQGARRGDPPGWDNAARLRECGRHARLLPPEIVRLRAGWRAVPALQDADPAPGPGPAFDVFLSGLPAMTAALARFTPPRNQSRWL